MEVVALHRMAARAQLQLQGIGRAKVRRPSPDSASPHASHCRVQHDRTAILEPALQALVRLLVVHLREEYTSKAGNSFSLYPRSLRYALHQM